MKKNIVFISIILLLLSISSIVYSNDTIVYIDEHDIDTDYHRLTCSFIPKNYKAISVEEAFAQGYRSCPICEPAISDAEEKLKEEEKQERLEKAKEIINSVSSTNNNISTSDSRIVYVTDTGSKYHISGCDNLDSTPHSLTVITAESKGYAPCKVCNPYELADTNEKFKYEGTIFIVISIVAILIIYIIFNEKRYKSIRGNKN